MAPEVKVEGTPVGLNKDGHNSQANTGSEEISSLLPVGNDDTAAIAILQDAAEVKNADDPDELTDKIHSSPYDLLAAELLATERAQGTLKERSKHAMLHITLTEKRIAELEAELQNIKKHVYGKEDNWFRRKQMHYVYRHTINRVDAQAFRITHRTFDVQIEERPVLEVSISALVTQQDSGDLHRRNTGLKDDKPDTPIPERLRVRSRPLLSHLQRITRTPSSYNEEVPKFGERENQDAVVFLRPFKLFVCYDREIRQSLLELQATIQNKKPQTDSQEDVSKEDKKNKAFEDEDLLEDLKLLIEFLDVDMKPVFDLRQQIQDATATDIEYPDLWHLFERGEIVLSQSNLSHAYRVVSYTGGREPLIDRLREEENTKPVDGFVVDFLSLKFDGTSYVPKLEKISIRRFHGKRPITSLPVYPLKLHPEANRLKSKFHEQGSLFLDLTRDQFQHKMMTGKTIDNPSQDVDGQVVVDIAIALNLNPEWQPESNITEASLTVSDKRETQMPPFCNHSRLEEGCCGSDVVDKDLELDQVELSKYFQESARFLAPRSEAELDEEELMLLPHWVYAFVLRSRRWVKLRTASLSDVVFENDFKALLLPEQQKRTIQALVAIHENAESNVSSGGRTVGSGIDIVKGKGTGLILLLHGEPGVGKTSTAECVADETQRALFPITCGDIGETAMEVEVNLHKNFNLAQRWGCVLLLDEADVFLAKRNKTDLRRNAVTSVFLRSLEYYGGILFLTSNRVGNIDPAFKSRIHMSVFYPRLNIEATRQLYEIFIKRVKAEQERANTFSFEIKKKEIIKFAKRHFRQMEKEGLATWNGRQIRNAFQAAIALAEYEGKKVSAGQPPPVLGESQFQIVAESSKEFDRYLLSTLGGVEADIAMRDNWRDDGFPNARGEQVPVSSATAYGLKHTGSQVAKDHESDDSSVTDSDDDDDGSSEDEKARKSSRPSGNQGSNQGHGSQNTQGANEYEEFQAFMRWKNSQK